MNYDEALETAISLAGDTAALEAFLNTVPAWRDQLRGEVRFALSAGRELRGIAPSAVSAASRQQELLNLINQHKRELEPAPTAFRAGLFTGWARPRLLASAAIAAAVLTLAFVVGLPALDGSATNKAEAVVIEGSVSDIGASGVTISTANSAELIRLNSDTVVTDGFGNALKQSAINAGQTVVLKGSRSEGGVVVNHVELKDRVFGTVTALASDSLRLRSGQTDYAIAIDQDTEIEGRVSVGAYVEVKVLRLSDGSLRALEIETEDEDESEDDGDHGSSSPTASAGSPAPGNTPSASGSGGSGPGDDDHDEDVEDHDEGDDSPDGEDREDHEDEPEEHEDEHDDD